jgi:hypothetical protein
MAEPDDTSVVSQILITGARAGMTDDVVVASVPPETTENDDELLCTRERARHRPVLSQHLLEPLLRPQERRGGGPFIDNGNVGPANRPGYVGGTSGFVVPEVVGKEATSFAANRPVLVRGAALLGALLPSPPQGESEQDVDCWDLTAQRTSCGCALSVIHEAMSRRLQ